MTKTFPLIPLNNYLYMVEWKINALEHKWYYHSDNGGDSRYINNLPSQHPVLASNDPSLKLPLLPAIEGKTPEQILKEIGYDNSSITATELWIAKEVYKAASKKWSDEDIRKAWKMTMGDIKNNPTEMIGSKHFIKNLESLNPSPTAIEVEMEDACSCPYGREVECVTGKRPDPQTRCQKPKVDKNNTITGRYIIE